MTKETKMDFTLQMTAFVDDLGYTVEIGTQVGFTEEAAKALPSSISDLGNSSFIVVDFLPNGTEVTMAAIRYEGDEPVIITPKVVVTVDKSQIGAI